ncbi:hypothetical protein PENSPDRAFT_680936 [Peniophora sp. CONT]|nr:hypothetical protein PENSPDRAFT_680936 [Peniophora sp. CONT]
MNITLLPVELLLGIFVRASEDTEDDKGAKTVFRLAGVCRDWRVLLLDYPRAWSTVSFAHPVATELMLQRSRTEPITIHLDLRGRLHPETEHRTSMARHTLERAHARTRRLTVIVDKDTPRNSARQILSNLSRPAAALETIEFLIANPFGSQRATFSIAPHNLAQLSLLKKLSLHDTLLNTVSCSLAEHCTSLVHLDLRTARGLSLSALLAILTGAQKTLETLKLDRFESPLKSGDTPVEPIYLPVLRELFLGLDSPISPRSHVAILEYITYPSTAHLAIHIHVWADALRALSSQAMLKTYLLGRGYQFRSILLDSIPSGLRLRYRLEREPPDLDNLGAQPAALLDLSIAGSCIHVVTDVLVSLADAANLANVERAVIKPLNERILWARLLVHTPKLTELSVYGSHNIRNLRFARRALIDSGTDNKSV